MGVGEAVLTAVRAVVKVEGPNWPWRAKIDLPPLRVAVLSVRARSPTPTTVAVAVDGAAAVGGAPAVGRLRGGAAQRDVDGTNELHFDLVGQEAVINVGTGDTISIVPTRARPTGETGGSGARSSHVCTGDASEAWSVHTPIGVSTGDTISAVPRGARAAVQTRAVVIAERVDVTGV